LALEPRRTVTTSVRTTFDTGPAKPPGPVARLGAGLLEVFQILGESALMLVRTSGELRYALRDRRRLIDQFIRVGSQTLPIASLVSLFIGMVMIVQAADQLANFTQEILGSIVGLSMTKELGPVVMGFLLAGRAGSAIAAEIGSMSVYDEIAALRTMDIDPVRFLAMPRVIAMTLALPCLILYSDAIGIIGGALVVALDPAIHISVNQYFDNLFEWINFTDVLVGLIKGAVFGLVVAVVSCTFGFRTRGGSEGVATSTTAAVVWSFVLIIVFDYLIVRMSFLL
jgi:phospholipid/cholesterol/gamma-HCH transport system permease protein